MSNIAARDIATVTEPADVARLILAGLQHGLPRRRSNGWSCPCGCAGLDDPSCMRHVNDQAAHYRRKIDAQRQAEGRRVA